MGTVVSGPHVILALKAAIIVVTVLLVASLAAVARGKYRLHGRLNTVFFVLTLTALLGLEVLIRLVEPGLFAYLENDPELRQALHRHLLFSLPAAAVLPLMIFTGGSHRRTAHLSLAAVFGVLWIGTVVTGLFYLPHTGP